MLQASAIVQVRRETSATHPN